MKLVSPSSSNPGPINKTRSVLIAVVALACALGLLGGAGAAVAKNDGQKALPVLHVGIAADISRPSPAQAGFGVAAMTYFGLAYAPLLRANLDGSFSPGLATSWRYVASPAGRNKAFQLTLRKNARFSNGQAVNAAAVAKWLNYFAGKTGGQFNALLGAGATFTPVGNWTVKIQLKIPNPSLPFILSQMRMWGFVAAPQAIDDESVFANGTYGAGPYVLVPSRSVSGDHYTFIPNRYYYNKSEIKFSEVDVKIISDGDSMLAALKSGQIDVAEGAAPTGPAAKAAGFNVVTAKAATNFIGFDRTGVLPESKPLTDVRVRQAINYAIDRAIIVRSLVPGGVATSEMSTADGFDAKLQNAYPLNRAKAKALLAAAGYANGFQLNLLVIIGSDEIAQVVADNLGQIGIKVNLTTTSTITDYLQKLSSRKYSAFSGASGNLPMVTWVRTTLLPGGVYNPFGVVDAPLAKDYFSALKAAKPATYWAKISQRMTNNAFFAPLFFSPVVLFSNNKKVKGVAVSSARVGMSMPIEWSPK
jgi:peptide/nickel transport system substrate-binding protein